MAIVKFGGGVSGIRGTIAGNTFSSGHSGAYVRAWSRGSNPRSLTQTAQRTTLTSLAQLWADVLESDKNNWDAWANLPAQEQTNPLGDPYYLSGFQWYVKMNCNLLTTGHVIHNAVPTLPVAPLPTSLTLTCQTSPPTSVLEYDLGGAPFDNDLVLHCALAQSAGPQVPPYRPRRLDTLQTESGTDIDLAPFLPALLGTLTPAQKLFVIVRGQTSEGYRSAPATITTIVI